MSQQKLNTDQLLARCKEGEQSAQMELYNRYYKAMYNTSVRIVNDPFEAEDVMQESFLNAFTKLDTYRGEVAFGAWLKRIVINNSIHHYRKQQRNSVVPLDDVLHRVEDSNGIEPDHEFTNIKAQKVLQTMKMLKDNYRIALTLHLIEGYDYEEISTIMNVSYANCRTTVSRAKESLRQKLKAEPYEA
ncbi:MULTISPECIES: RNA polymerase sigma factor [Galbibacter]|uniref:RNA polymerase sigma factor n=1 Tax=Galbibacter pacificus TaxID=2996052 RepID=A0ABT6FV99_9FLAO|nr:RNA polymerase sigma factor [Galbibacter pacificus]MDG3583491.1 RNA polymerase sigma factor [Galbibacter pacificus]MDG3587032.1 RNA polymerase sigma factor [Galbibacter pacificus]